MLATFSGAGSVLTIDLNNANEVVTFTTNGTIITATLTGGTAVDGGGTGGNITGFGTGAVGIVSSGFTTFNITDSAAGTSIVFADSGASVYSQGFGINLNDPASGNISFTGNSTFGVSFNATTIGGMVSSAPDSHLLLATSANLAITATGHDVLFQGAVLVAGTTSIAANVVQLDNAANDFNGTLQLTGPSLVSVFDSNLLALATSSFSLGTAGQTSHITAAKDITQTGPLTVTGSGTLDISSLSSSITLNNTANSIAASAATGFSVTGASNITFSNSGVTPLGNVSLETGTFQLTSRGTITQQSSTGITTGGNISLAIDTNTNRDILLNSNANHIAGSVTVAETNGGTVRDFSLRNLDPHASSPTGTPFTTAGDIRNLTLLFDHTGVVLPGYNITGALTVSAGGDITQSAALTVGTTSNFTVQGDFGIIVNNSANAFTGPVSLNAAESTQHISVENSSSLVLGLSKLGRGVFDATSVTGNVTQNGTLTQEKSALPATFTVMAGGSISLSLANGFTSPIVFTGAALSNLSIHNADFLANFSALTIPASVTDLTVTFDNASMVLPTLSLANLTATGQGIVQASGANLHVTGAGTFNANSFPLNLSNSGNDFANVNLLNSGRNDVAISDINDLTLVGNSTLGSGRLTINVGGNLSEPVSSRVTQANVGADGEVTLSSTGGSISLNGNTNALRGPVSMSVAGANTITLNNNSILTLDQVTIGSGAFSATAAGLGIVQSPNSVLKFGGSSSFTASAGTGAVTLTNATNTFAGPVTLNVTTNASLRTTGPLIFNASNVGLMLTAQTGGTSADSIMQVGALLVPGGVFNSGAGSVTLDNAGNDFATVSVTSSGAAVTITDTNAFNIGSMKLGTGTLTLNAGADLGLPGGGSIVQAPGAGAVSLTTPVTNNIMLDSTENAFTGQVTVTHSKNVTLVAQGDLHFTPTSAITGAFVAQSGGVLTLPTALTNLVSLTTSAQSTVLPVDVTASGTTGISISGSVTTPANGVLISGGGVTFSGDVTLNGNLSVTLANSAPLTLDQGVWTQGSNTLTLLGTNAFVLVGDGIGGPAAFNITTGTVSMPGNGDFSVSRDGTLNVGSGNTPETATIANGTGLLVFTGTLGVGLGATNDELIKTGTGMILVGATARLTGTGLAGTTASPVLAAPQGKLAGFFQNSVDAADIPHDFFAASDILTPVYDLTQLAVKAGGLASSNGSLTGFLPDGDKYVVTSSLGASASLAGVVDVTGHLGIVIRNTTASGASTLTISTPGGGDGLLPIAGISDHAPGSLSISAPAADFSESVTTVGALTSLTARDLIGNSALMPFILKDGGATTASTSLTVRNVQLADIELSGTLAKLSAVSVTKNVDITAQKFGTITTSNQPLGTDPNAPGAPTPGDFAANLTSTTSGGGIVLTSAKIAGTLAGVWDFNGSVGTVTASSTGDFTLGPAAGADVVNGGGFVAAKSLSLGVVDAVVINATGAIGTLTTTDITNSEITAGSFGTIKIAPDKVRGLLGGVDSSTFVATGNAGGMALKSFSAADFSNSSLIVLDGDLGSFSVSQVVSNSTILADAGNNHGNIKSITAGNWQSNSLDARTVGTFKVTGNLAADIFGDVTGSTVTLEGNNKGVALAAFSAQGSVSTSSFSVLNGNLTSFIVGRQLSSTSVKLTDAAFGVLGTIQAGDWASGDAIVAKTIGTVASVGAPELNPASPALLGGMATDTIFAYLNSGTTGAIGKVTVHGNLASSTIKAEHGVGSITVGRTFANSLIVADDSMAAALNVGRIASFTAGMWSSDTVSANTLGMVKVTGYAPPNDSFVAGDVLTGSLIAHGATPSKPDGIDLLSVAGTLTQNSFVAAPFGIKTLTVGSSVNSSSIVTDNPLAPTSGFIGSLTAGELSSSAVRAGSISSLKVTGSTPFALLGNVLSSTIAINSTASAKGGAQALGTLTVAGDFVDSVLDAPGSVSSISVTGRIASVNAETKIQAGYAMGAKLGGLTAGAWGEAGSNITTDLVTQSVATMTLKGNVTRGYRGTTDEAFIDILGNTGGIGLGKFSATGAATGSLFRVSDGDVTSFSVLRFVTSDLLAGFRLPASADLTTAPASANWSATNHKIGSFTTTAPFDASDVEDSASFANSNVVAAVLGSITIAGVNPDTADAIAFGVAFRTSAGASAAGTVKANGTALTAPATTDEFSYLGLAG